MLLPYLEGERTPNIPEGSGVWVGLNKQTLQAGHLARAAMEGATMGMNYGLRRLAALGVKAKEIRVTGGGAKSPVWRQVMADVFGVPVVAMVEDEGAALGGALRAAQGVDGHAWQDLYTQFSPPDRDLAVEPDPATWPTYQQLGAEFEKRIKEVLLEGST